MKERHLQLKKYQIPKKVASSNGSLIDGQAGQSNGGNIKIFSSLLGVNSL